MHLKKLHLFLLLLTSIPLLAQADTTEEAEKYRLYMQSGLFKTSYAVAKEPGMFLQAGAGFKLNEHFWLNFDILHAESKGSAGAQPLFDPDIVNTTVWMFMPNFAKDFNLSAKSSITGTIGGFYIREYRSEPDYDAYDDGNITYLTLRMSNTTEHSVGLYLGAAYKYRLNKNILVGLQLSGYVQMYLDPEAFMVGPVLEFRL